MKEDKLKSLGIRYFVVPFSILLILFLIMNYVTINNRISERYSRFESEAISIEDSYSHALVYSHDAYDIITELLDDKLMLAIQAISMIEEKYDNDILSRIGHRLLLDEIYIYNSEAEIIFSKDYKYLGWKAYEGHPVHDFILSDQKILVEDIRKDSESDNYLKYAYYKNDDGTFLQVGILAETVNRFLQRFEIYELMDSFSSRTDVMNVMFINNDFEIVASSLPEYIGDTINDEEFRKSILEANVHTIKTTLNEQDVFQVSVPVMHDGDMHGTLSVAWLTNELESEVRRMFVDSAILFFAIVLILGVVLYYAFTKNVSNIKIAYYDKLTGLPNHEYLLEFLEDQINNVGNKNKAIFLLNCRNFKTLNTTGFIYGNKVLKEIVNKVNRIIDSNDRLFRFGADRFVLVIDNYLSTNQLTSMAERIVEIFKYPLSGNVEHQYIDVEISIVEITERNANVDKLLQDATLALDYIDKNSNNQVCFYQDFMEKPVIRQDIIERALRAIIENESNEKQSLYLNFQPKWSLIDNRLMGFESLARLNIEELGDISPIEFIDIAEKRMLIYDLGNHILRQACKFLKKINDMGYDDIKVSVNISVIQLLRDEFVKDIAQIIESSGIEKSSLVLEITESIIMENFDLINDKLKEIRKTGILIALDDFGTGFSSLSRLRELNIDYVKIDKCFIDKITENNDESLITADIISMSHKVGLSVVAEGVEKEGQIKYLAKNGCDILQGYYISRPLAENKAIDFILNQPKL